MTVSLSPSFLPVGERDDGSLREFHVKSRLPYSNFDIPAAITYTFISIYELMAPPSRIPLPLRDFTKSYEHAIMFEFLMPNIGE